VGTGKTSITIWLVDTFPKIEVSCRNAMLETLGRGFLSAAEYDRALRFSSDLDSAQYVLAHVATRQILAESSGVSPSSLSWNVGKNGKPGPTSAGCWNLSRSGGHALVALAERDVGVDLQIRDPRIDALRIVMRYVPSTDDRLSGEDPWVLLARLEACAKAVGGRLLDVLSLDVTKPGLVRGVSGPWAGQEWWVSDLFVSLNAAAACATLGPRPHETIVRTWEMQ
jgi:4'-phosphopantetheinyl transferase